MGILIMSHVIDKDRISQSMRLPRHRVPLVAIKARAVIVRQHVFFCFLKRWLIQILFRIIDCRKSFRRHFLIYIS